MIGQFGDNSFFFELEHDLAVFCLQVNIIIIIIFSVVVAP